MGNGRLGAMVFGGAANERIQFNEDTLWQGEPRSYANPGAHRWLDRLRSLLFEGKQAAAEELAMERFMSVPLRQKPYQSFADLLIERTGIDAAAVTGYRRSLDIENAVARVQFSADGIQHSQEVFASFPKQVLAVRLAASGTGNLSFAAGFGTSHSSQVSTEAGGGLRLSGRVEGGAIRFEARLAVQTDGTVSSDGERLRVQGASEATLLLAGATNFVNFRDVSGDPSERNAAVLAEAAPVPYRALRDENSDSHRQLFRRVLLDLGTSEAAAEPTDVRIERFASRPDPHLVTLLFQYGRYLLISSSRGRCQPANLQGLWNDLDQPPWDSKYTVNINTEMNYWPAESTGLPETHEPLFAALREIAVSGAETAREHYRARGWVLHHNFDLWRGTAPINHSNHGIWPTGGAWLCQDLWQHYLYGGDEEFLREDCLPLDEGRVGVLPRRAGRIAGRAVADLGAEQFPGERGTGDGPHHGPPDRPQPARQHNLGGHGSGIGRGVQGRAPAGARTHRAESHRPLGPVAGVAWKTSTTPPTSTVTSRTCSVSIRVLRSRHSGRRTCSPRLASPSSSAVTERPAGQWAGR